MPQIAPFGLPPASKPRMDNITKIHEICLRIDHLESAGDWLARTLVHVDNSASQTGTLVSVLASDVRERLLELVTCLEKQLAIVERELKH